MLIRRSYAAASAVRHLIRGYASKPKSHSLTQKQMDKRMSQKIVQEQEPDFEEPVVEMNIPNAMNGVLIAMQIPNILFLGSAYSHDFFTAGFTDSIGLSYDWLGFGYAATGGVMFGLLSRNNWAMLKQHNIKPKSFFLLSVVPVISSAATLTLIHTLDIYSWAPIVAGLLVNLFYDAAATERRVLPKYWMALKIRHAMLFNFVIFITSMSLLTFKDYIANSEMLLSKYQMMAHPEAGVVDEYKKTYHVKRRDGWFKPEVQIAVEREEKSDQLADPTK